MTCRKIGTLFTLFLVTVFLLSVVSVAFAGSGEKGEKPAAKAAAFKWTWPPLEGKGLAPVSDESVFFRGWQYKTHIVQDNIKRYNSELGGKVDYATITGDYPSIMETQFIAKAPLDILYANPSQACRYLDGGWIIPAENLPNADKIKADMYDNIREAWTYKGKLLGLSYFVSVRGILHCNLKKLQSAGMKESDIPGTWDELWDQLFVLRDKGVQYPFLPHWFGEWFGISWGFAFEVMNRGGMVADAETHKPMLTVDGPAGETLRDWKRAWNAGLIPKEVLQYLEPDYLDAWASGVYVYSPQQSYDFKRFNEERYSTFAGFDIPAPFKGQAWGLIDSAMYLMSNRQRSADHTHDIMAFDSWYGYRDQNGDLFVAQRWIEESMLFTAYKPVMESAKNKELMKTFFARPQDYDTMIQFYSRTPYPAGVWNVVWAETFNSWLKETLSKFLLEDQPVDQTIKAINDKIIELNKMYGIM